MRSYKLVLEYDGSLYNGFQRQTATSELVSGVKRPRLDLHQEGRTRHKRVPITIQDCLEEALARWTNCSIPDLRLRCAGRTDKGVHATGQVVAIDIPTDEAKNVLEALEEWQMCRAMNSRLPSDISIKSMSSCDASFEPRHEAKRKQYTYQLRYRRLVLDEDNNKQPLPICGGGPQTLRHALDESCLWLCPWALDDVKMESICSSLEGKHDFSCFVHKEARRKKDNLIDLEKFHAEYLDVSQEQAPVVNVKFTLEACGFRRSMIRNLVGFVVDVCRGLLSQEDVQKVLTGSDEGAALVHSAPPTGLCLTHVSY